MEDAFLCAWGTVIVIGAIAKLIVFFLPFGKEYVKQRSHGPYREMPEGRLEAARTEIDLLTRQLAKAEAEGAKKDTMIDQLWFKAYRTKHPRIVQREANQRRVNHVRFAGVISIATAGGMVIGALAMVPSHDDSVVPTHARPTMQVPLTSGGEVPFRPPATPEPNRYCLAPADMHVIRFESYHIYWPSPFRKPDEFDLAFWLMHSRGQEQVIVATLY